MLQTYSEQPDLQLEGVDQQDFSKLQIVKGTFPLEIGMQQRLPGKTIQKIYPGPIGSIYVFYLVFGRHYQLTDFGGGIEIVEVEIPDITPPGLPPTSSLWIDTFSGYDEDLISRIWGAGIWGGRAGICETIITGFYDPFLVYDKVTTPPPEEVLPVPIDDGGGEETALVPPGSPDAMYPPGYVEVVLHVNFGHTNDGCTGQGSHIESNADIVRLRPYSGADFLEEWSALDVPVGSKFIWHGHSLGRDVDTDVGVIQGSCGPIDPPLPARKEYSIYINTNLLTLDS